MNDGNKGRRGEDLAVAFLLNRGYRILERNWRRKSGEIDIIAAQGPVLVFCEVKSRSSSVCGSGAEAVNRRKQLHIIHTALLYLQQEKRPDVPCRFDILEVNLVDPAQPQLNHLINAFGL